MHQQGNQNPPADTDRSASARSPAPPADRCLIAGCGMVSAQGVGVDACWANIIAGRVLTDHSPVPLASDGQSRVTQLALLAAREALAAAGWQGDAASGRGGGSAVGATRAAAKKPGRATGVAAEGRAGPRTVLIIGTSKGPVDDWLIDKSTRRRNVASAEATGGGMAIGWSVSGGAVEYPGANGDRTLQNKATRGGAVVSQAAALPWVGLPGFAPAGIAPAGIASTADEVACALSDVLPQAMAMPRLTCSAACASGLVALAHARRMLLTGRADRAIVIGVESSLHALFVGSFAQMGVLAPAGFGCRPFDEDRAGFVVSEAAAAVCLEREGRATIADGTCGRAGDHDADGSSVNPDSQPSQRGLRQREMPAGRSGRVFSGRVVLADAIALSDAHHLTSVDPAAGTLREVLRRLGRRGKDGEMMPIDLLHAHGTGTRSNDPAELAAVCDAAAGGCFVRPPADSRNSASQCVHDKLEMQTDPTPLHIYSHKASLGHTQGAAGLLAVVLNVASHQRQMILPNAATSRPILAEACAATGVVIAGQPTAAAVRASMVVAAGFGGPVAGVRLESE